MSNNFVFIVPSYNNELYYKKNLSSIFNQIYKNWHDHATTIGMQETFQFESNIIFTIACDLPV